MSKLLHTYQTVTNLPVIALFCIVPGILYGPVKIEHCMFYVAGFQIGKGQAVIEQMLIVL